MRRGFGQSLRLGIAPGAVSLLQSRRWGAPALSVLAEHPLDLAAAGGQAGAALAGALEALLGGGAYAGWPLSIVLDDSLVRLWQVSLPQGVARLADIDAAAAMRFQMLYGEPATGWKMAAHLDAATPVFAAIPLALLAQLEQAAASHKVTIVGIEPHFIAAWNRWQGVLRADAWFALVHDQLITLGVAEGRRLRAVRVLQLPAGAGHYWLTQTVAREALLLGASVPAVVQAAGQVPASWRPAPADSSHIGCIALQADLGAAFASPATMLAAAGSRA